MNNWISSSLGLVHDGVNGLQNTLNCREEILEQYSFQATVKHIFKNKINGIFNPFIDFSAFF